MNKTEREPYLILANLTSEGWGLCNWCKYAEWSGWSCCEGELECKHPLDVINDGRYPHYDHPNEVWGEGADCWGFKPLYSLQECGVIASIRAKGQIVHKSKRYGEWIGIIPSERDKEYM